MALERRQSSQSVHVPDDNPIKVTASSQTHAVMRETYMPYLERELVKTYYQECYWFTLLDMSMAGSVRE